MTGEYGVLAAYYDKLYAWKDYAAEAGRLIEIVGGDGRGTLLDVACGTGRHLEHLRERFDVEGLDLSSEQLAIARQRIPGVPLHEADMRHFSLGRTFDVVTCLFSSIGYAKTLREMQDAIECMRAHVKPGGALAIEPWFTPDAWQSRTVHAVFVDEPELKIARVNTSFAVGRASILDLHYLIGTPDGTEHLLERHEMGLYTTAEMQAALRAPGWTVAYDEEGLSGRGLYVARRGPSRRSVASTARRRPLAGSRQSEGPKRPGGTR